MRIIKYGSIEEQEMQCPNCKTIFAYCENDIEGSKQAGYFGITCPLCGKFIDLTDGNKHLD